MLRHCTIFSFVLCTCSQAMAAESYQVQIEAPSELKEVLTQYLDLVTQREEPDIDEEQIEAMVASTPEEANNLLKTEGYFQAKVSVTQKGDAWVISVVPGPQVTIKEVLISIEGPIQNDQEIYQQRLATAKEEWTLPVGSRFRQEDWTNSKKEVLQKLTAERYPLATMTASRALVDPDTHSATLIAHYDSGPEVSFGELEIKGNKRYPVKVAAGMADFSPGSPYDQQKLLDYQNRLEQDAHYSGAIVTPDFKQIENGRVPLIVELTEVPRQKIELGFSYDTVDGPGIRVNYEHYNIFKRGYTGSIFTDLKRDEKKVSLGLGFPRQSDNYSHSISMTYEDSDVQNVRTKSLSSGIWRSRDHGNIRSRIGIEYLAEKSNIVDGEPLGNTHALMGTFGWTQHAVDNEMHPLRGYLADFTISATPGKLASSTAIVRGYARAVGYLTPWPNQYGTFVGRFEAGQVWAKDSSKVPETLLFRTGGANTVRGYEYQSLGIKDGDAVLGGRVLAVGSVEYQYPFTDSWSGAVFYDTGNAADSWSSFNTASGYGVGVRWFSPIAPLSFDIAHANEDNRWRWNLSLGLAF